MTINQIVKKLEEIQSLHRQLNSFYFGDPSEVSSGEAKTYPLMGVFIQPGTISLRQDSLRLLLYFADRIEDQDEILQREVISDMRRVALGAFSQFKAWLENNSIAISPEAPFSYFNDSDWDDKCYGWQLEITINQFFASAACEEPSSFDVERDETGQVRIYDIETGETIDTRNPGQEYGVYRFSGIIDNGPPYSNTIIDPGN